MSEQNLLQLYVGTYTREGSDGVYLCHFDPESGELGATRCVAEMGNPTFLAVHPRLPVLYAVCDDARADGKGRGQASAYAIDAVSGELSLMSSAPTGRGRPCHASVDATGSTLFFAEYGGATAGALPLDAEGRPGPVSAFFDFDHASEVNAKRQAAAHAHSINVGSGNRFVYVPDLGGDRIYIFAFDAATHALVPAEPPFVASTPGAGPRHMTFHAESASAFSINELNGTITHYGMDGDTGALTAQAEVDTLPEGFSGANTTADIHLSPDGRFLYGSNRGHDSIVVYAFTGESPSLRLVQSVPVQGEHPRNFTIDPSGRFLLAANRDTDNIVVFARDMKTGLLSDTGHRAKVSMPVCLKWGPAAASN